MNRTALRALAAALLAAVLVGGCATNPATGNRQPRLISVEQEVAMGREAAPQLEQEFGGKVANPTLQAYVAQVGAKLAAASDWQEVQYEYSLLGSNVANAFALPGGKIYVTAGLMEIMTNERQLAAVLGHETAHVAAWHSVSQLQQQMGLSVLVKLAGQALGGKEGQAAQAGAKIAAAMVGLRYSREHENEADEYGLKYLVQAGHSPWGMVEMLQVLEQTSREQPSRIGEWFRTHPYTADRISQTKDMIEAESRYRAHPAGEPDPQAGRFLEMRSLLP